MLRADAPSDSQRDWRVGHRGRDCVFYEELHGGAWRRIEIDGEMLMGLRMSPAPRAGDASARSREHVLSVADVRQRPAAVADPD